MNSAGSAEQGKTIIRRGSLNYPIQNPLENKLSFQLGLPTEVKKFPVFDNPQSKDMKPGESTDPTVPPKITGLEFTRDKILQPSNVQPLGFGVKKVGNGNGKGNGNIIGKARRGSHDFITTPENQMYTSQLFPKQGTPKTGLEALARQVGKEAEGEIESPVRKFKPSVINTKNLVPPDESLIKAGTINFASEKKEDTTGSNSPIKITNNLDYIRRKKPMISTTYKTEGGEDQTSSPLLHPEELYSPVKKSHFKSANDARNQEVEASPLIVVQKVLSSEARSPMPTLIFRKKFIPDEPKCTSARNPPSQRFPQSYSPSKRPRRPPCLDDFMVGKKLGKGKYGDVFAVKHRELGFVCAMKMISKNLIREQNIQQQFVRELKIQCYLTHANVTAMYGYFDDVDNVYLLLEICYDGHLMRVLKERERGRLPEIEAKEIVRQICKGVEYIHRQKVLHRDIKPQNIIIHEGLYKLCDFGWARYTQNEMSQTFCGSPLYVSPEILKGELYNDKIDIWSIGVLTYEMLFGKPPFKINSQQDLSRIITDDITFPEYVQVSSEGKDFITRILKKNPEERYDIDELLEHPFVRVSPKESSSFIDFNLNI